MLSPKISHDPFWIPVKKKNLPPGATLPFPWSAHPERTCKEESRDVNQDGEKQSLSLPVFLFQLTRETLVCGRHRLLRARAQTSHVDRRKRSARCGKCHRRMGSCCIVPPDLERPFASALLACCHVVQQHNTVQSQSHEPVCPYFSSSLSCLWQPSVLPPGRCQEQPLTWFLCPLLFPISSY